MIVQDFVVVYALLPVLVDVEAVVAVLAKGLVPEDAKEAAEAALVVVPESVRRPVLVLVPEDAQEVVRIHALLVRMVVPVTAQVIVRYCAKADAQDAPVDVQGLVNQLVQVSVKGAGITALASVSTHVPEDVQQLVPDVVDHLAEILFSATILVQAFKKQTLMEEI